MMLFILTVLLSVVYSVTGDCHATNVQTQSPGQLPPMVKDQLEQGPDSIDLNNPDLTGISVTYNGFPNDLDPSVQFLAVCISSTQLPQNPFCRNLTSINGEFGNLPLTKADFVSFYQQCGDDPNFNFNK